MDETVPVGADVAEGIVVRLAPLVTRSGARPLVPGGVLTPERRLPFEDLVGDVAATA